MSSLRNAVASQRREHRERSQPSGRAARFPLLEKKKDYLLRARDYRSKQARLARLWEKTKEKNPDEFYFKMVRERTSKGVVVHERGNRPLDQDMLKILKAQDQNYLRTVARVERKRVDSLKKFVQTDEKMASESEQRQTHLKFADDGSAEPAKPMLDAPSSGASDPVSGFRRRMRSHLERLEKLQILEQESQLHRHLMAKGPRKKIVGKDGDVLYKWKPQRKK